MSFIANNFRAGSMTGSAFEIVAALAPVERQSGVSPDLARLIASAAQARTEYEAADGPAREMENLLEARCPRPQIPAPLQLDRDELLARKNLEIYAPRLPANDRELCISVAREDLEQIKARRAIWALYEARHEAIAAELNVPALTAQADAACERQTAAERAVHEFEPRILPDWMAKMRALITYGLVDDPFGALSEGLDALAELDASTGRA